MQILSVISAALALYNILAGLFIVFSSMHVPLMADGVNLSRELGVSQTFTGIAFLFLAIVFFKLKNR